MSSVLGVVALSTGLLAFVLTYIMRRVSLARGLMDVPNERSSHVAPTPRGGGVAIVVAALAAFGALWVYGLLDRDLFAALMGGGLLVAVIGLIDDRRPLPASVRLIVHVAAAVWALKWLGGAVDFHIPGPSSVARAVNYLLAGIGIVWFLNLYNFMDGIDGIAASEACFAAWGGAFVLLMAGGSAASVPASSIAFGAAALGFLLWNWPPAKIFMGDVGSGFIGYIVAILPLAATREFPHALFVLPLLSGVFFVDATVTLLRRLGNGERVFSAHRSHAYQRLARRWRGHKAVTRVTVATNLLWLLPWAYFGINHPDSVLWVTSIALAPLVIVALTLGAGRPDGV